MARTPHPHGTITGRHRLLAAAGIPTSGWHFLAAGERLVLDKGDVVQVWGTEGTALIHADAPLVATGPLNWRRDTQDTWHRLRSADRTTARVVGLIALLAAAGFFLLGDRLDRILWTEPHGWEVAALFLLAICALSLSATAFFRAFVERIQHRTTIDLPKRAAPRSTDGGGDDGLLSTHVVAQDGRLDTTQAGHTSGEGFDGGGDRDGGGGGGGGGGD